MHPLRLILLLALTICLASSVTTVWLISHAEGAAHDGSLLASVGLAGLVLLALFLPTLSIYLWTLRRMREIDEVTRRAKEVVEGRHDQGDFRPGADETDDLSRAADELRKLVVRQSVSFEEQKALNRKVLDSLLEGIVAINASRRVVFTNPRAREMFGIEGPVIGQPAAHVVRHQRLLAALDAALEGEESSTRSDLGERQFEIWAAPVSSEEIAAIACIVDVTHVVKLERLRSDFLADFSHEVRTPLAALRSAAETFEHADLDPEQEGRLRGIITRQTVRLERLVQDLSELSRIESGELLLNRQPVDVRALLVHLRDDFEREIPSSRGARIHGPSVSAELDPVRTEQIFSNLLDNAFKYGGNADEVSVEIVEEPEHVAVRVSDRGPGIAREDLERIFHRFYRADRSRSQAIPGVGLGLAIARHLALLQGGTIRAESAPSRGTTFEVRFPRRQPSASVR